MRQYFEPQAHLTKHTYYERHKNPASIAPTELYIRTVDQSDVDVLASEFEFVEWVHDYQVGFKLPVLKRL